MRRLITALGLAIVTGLLIIWPNLQSNLVLASFPKSLTKTTLYSKDLTNSPPLPNSPTPSLPHPLPPTLMQWRDRSNSGDYFAQVAATQVGYLVWSQFPVKIYIEIQPKTWFDGVSQVVKEWNTYLPLQVVEKPEAADILIIRKAPPLQTSPDGKILRARSAQTTYEFYTSKNNLLSHRFKILLSPTQTGDYLTAAARHELGHALGIWGHSPLQTDALYFSQVRNPPPISSRDVNTLKRIYEQPTSLGWYLY
nr:peptidase [Iningainema tapete]